MKQVIKTQCSCHGAGPEAYQEHIKALVDEWPPFTAEQRDRLAVLLRPRPEVPPSGGDVLVEMLGGR